MPWLSLSVFLHPVRALVRAPFIRAKIFANSTNSHKESHSAIRTPFSTLCVPCGFLTLLSGKPSAGSSMGPLLRDTVPRRGHPRGSEGASKSPLDRPDAAHSLPAKPLVDVLGAEEFFGAEFSLLTACLKMREQGGDRSRGVPATAAYLLPKLRASSETNSSTARSLFKLWRT